MSKYTYDRLTFLDSTFVIMELPQRPMHVAGTSTFEAGPLKKRGGGIDIDRIRNYVDAKLHLIPRYRQRLAFIPVEDHPVWVDDHHFNIMYHVRHTALPQPGDERQLKRLAARVMEQPLDRSKPLWEIWVVEGLENPDHFALVQKVHHCMIDGMSSVDLMNVLLKQDSTPEFEPGPRWIPRRVPSQSELFVDAARRYLRLPITIGRNLPRWLRALADTDSEIRVRLAALRESLAGQFNRASATPLNQVVGPHRRFDWMPMDLDRIKGVKNRLGGTVNDIVLATVAGAVRRFLQRRGVHVEDLDFRVMAPVSTRTEQERGTLGNRVSAWTVPLPLGEPDPVRRLDQIRHTTEHLKESNQALGAELLSQVGEWTPSTLLSMGARLAARALPFNLVVTNVPGPQAPLYMLGAKMLNNYGFIPLTDNLGLGIVLFSYAGQLCWAFTADWDLLPDLHDFVRDVRETFAELCAVPQRSEALRRPLRARGGAPRRAPRRARA